MNDITFREKKEWSAFYKNVGISVVHHAFDSNNGKGIWNYYLCLHEKYIPDFDKLWLKDKKEKLTNSSYISHDYLFLPFSNFFHGGITFYEKRGHTKGFRTVKVGCDYNHLWDQEANFPYDFQWVKQDAINAADQLVEFLGIRQA